VNFISTITYAQPQRATIRVFPVNPKRNQPGKTLASDVYARRHNQKTSTTPRKVNETLLPESRESVLTAHTKQDQEKAKPPNAPTFEG
jgi:hypothetical protein